MQSQSFKKVGYCIVDKNRDVRYAPLDDDSLFDTKERAQELVNYLNDPLFNNDTNITDEERLSYGMPIPSLRPYDVASLYIENYS